MLVGLMLAPAAFSAFPGRPGRIAFTHYYSRGFFNPPDCDGTSRCVYQDFAEALRSVRADGKRRRSLSDCRGNERCGDSNPMFSPDGRRLVFNDGGRLAISRPNGSRRRAVPLPADDVIRVHDPAWSPDGRQLAFYAVRDYPGTYRYDIFVADRDGANPRAVTDGVEDLAPSWSTRGLIAFQRGLGFDEQSDIYVVDPRTGSERRVTWRGGSDPAWASDGVRLAFTRGKNYYSKQSLYVFNTRTKRLRRITRGSALQPAWSPDGRFIVFGCRAGLCKVSPKGRRVKLVARAPNGSYYGADWQPLPRRRR